MSACKKWDQLPMDLVCMVYDVDVLLPVDVLVDDVVAHEVFVCDEYVLVLVE